MYFENLIHVTDPTNDSQPFEVLTEFLIPDIAWGVFLTPNTRLILAQ